MSSNKYNIDFKKLIIWALPKPLRKDKIISLLMAFIMPVVKLFNLFGLFRQLMIYKISITPQVCYLEKLLNDRYDTAQRRISIVDPKEYEYLYVFLKVENKPVPIWLKSENKPVFIYTRAETSRFGVDFIVVIPSAVKFNDKELIELLNGYKLPTKKFKIKVI